MQETSSSAQPSRRRGVRLVQRASSRPRKVNLTLDGQTALMLDIYCAATRQTLGEVVGPRLRADLERVEWLRGLVDARLRITADAAHPEIVAA